MPENLKVTIGGDASGLQSELKKAQAELGKTALAANKLDSSLGGLGKSSLPSLFNLTEKLRDLQSSVFTEKDRAKIAAYNQQIKATEVEIAKLNALGTAGAGGGAFSGITSGASKAFGAVRQLAYILPGVGIAGILAFATEPIIKYLSSISFVSDSIKKIKEQQDALNEAFAGGQTGFVKATIEVSNLRIAIDQAKQGIITKGEALKLYNDTIGKTTGAVNSLEAAETALNKNANAYIQFTLLKAAANFALEKAAKSAFDAEAARVKKAQEFQSVSTNASVFSAGQSSAPGFVPGASNLNTQLAARANAAQKAKDKVIQIAEDAKKSETDIANKFLSDAQDIAKKFNFDFNAIKEPKGTTKKIESITDVIKKLRLELDYLNTKEIQLNTDEAKAKISALENAIKELITKFGAKGKAAAIPLFAEIKEIQLSEKLKRKDFGAQTKIEVQAEIIPKINGLSKSVKLIFDEIERVKEEAAKKLEKFRDLFAGIGEDIFTSFAEGIGNAVKGGSFSGFFDGILKAVGNGLKKLGVYFLAGSKLIAQIKKLIITLPAVSAVAALGLIALGTAISAGASKQGFASGTTSTPGGTFLVGERGPERIFLPQGSKVQPNNELQAFGGGSISLQPSIRYEGSGFRIMLNRVDAQFRRNN